MSRPINKRRTYGEEAVSVSRMMRVVEADGESDRAWKLELLEHLKKCHDLFAVHGINKLQQK